MKVALDREMLEEIVGDGMKEMMSRLNLSRSQRKKKWGRDLAWELNKYKIQICEEFITVLIEDFAEPVEVKFSGVKMEENEVRKLKDFLDKVEKSKADRYRKILLESTAELMKNIDPGVFIQVVGDCHDWILRRIELYIRSVILEKVHTLTVSRGKIEATIYNFVDGDIPDDIKELFKNGIDSVPSIRMSRKEVNKRVEETLVAYLDRYRKRKNPVFQVHSTDVKDWISEAKKLPMDEESSQFYTSIEEGYDGMKAEIDLAYKEEDIDNEKEIRMKLEKAGCVIVLCDKNMGMSMFTLETMRIADKKLMEQLGAMEVEGSKEEILESVFLKIEEFEKNLTSDQKDYMNYAFNDRNVRRCKTTFPFLKSTHKVHKMSEEQISSKDLSCLKFRPVVDAKRWATRGYAALVMGMMRKANKEVLMRAGPVMSKMMVKNGWKFAKTIQEYCIEDCYDIMLSADIQEAYTNITAKMINEAIVVVCQHVEFEDWKIDLMTKLIDLVLSQNYVM